MASRHSSSRSASCGQGEIRWHGVQDDPGTVELRTSLPTLPAGERHILVHDADRRRRVGSAVRLRPLVAQTAHPGCPWVTSPVAVSDPNSFEDGALGPLESDAERGMERGKQEPMNALMCIRVNYLQDINIGNRGSQASADSPKTSSRGGRTGGGNSVYLSVTQTAKGYSDNRWATYKQIKDMGGQVRKGEKATHALFYKFDDEKEKQQPGAPADSGLYATPLSQRSRRSRASTTADRIASPHGNITHPPQPAKIQPA